jgi:glycosyltransferase involved in cell wall biosynthesis
MKISHIICTRNRADQLSVTLAKFNTALMAAHQIELVLVDGESTDDTPKVMADFAEKYKRTKIVRVGNGLGRAHNACIEAAKGDLIAFTDDDCYLDDKYYTALRLPPLSVLERLEREFRGAADYIRYRLDVGDTPGKEKPRTPDAGQPSVETPSPKRAQGSKA